MATAKYHIAATSTVGTKFKDPLCRFAFTEATKLAQLSLI